MDLKLGKSLHDLHRFKTNRQDLEEERQRISGISLLCGEVVEVVDNAAVLVHFHAGTLNNPVKSGTLVNHVLLSLKRDALDRDEVVVDELRLVLGGIARLAWNLAVLHLRDVVGPAFTLVDVDLDRLVLFDLLEVHVQLSQLAARLLELLERLVSGHARDARKLLHEVVGVAGAVFLRMQDAVDVVEDRIRRDVLTRVTILEVLQGFRRNRILALITSDFILRRSVLEEGSALSGLGAGLLFVEVAWEALRVTVEVQVGDAIAHQGDLTRTIRALIHADGEVARSVSRVQLRHLVHAVVPVPIEIKALIYKRSIDGFVQVFLIEFGDLNTFKHISLLRPVPLHFVRVQVNFNRRPRQSNLFRLTVVKINGSSNILCNGSRRRVVRPRVTACEDT